MAWWCCVVLCCCVLMCRGRRREEEEEARRQALLRVPRKRFEALDKQLRGVETVLSKLVDHAALSLQHD